MRWFCTLLLLSTLLLGLQARDAGAADSGAATSSPQVLVDAQGALDLAKARASKDWQSLASLDTASRLAGNAVWLRWELPAPAAGNGAEVVQIAPAATDRVDVWLLSAGRVIAEHQLGRSLPFAKRALDHTALAVPLPTGRPRNDLTLIARQQSMGPIRFMPMVRAADEFARTSGTVKTSRTAYFGAMAALLALGLMLFVAANDRAYLAFAGWSGALALLVLQHEGFLFQVAWPNRPHWNANVEVIATALLAAASAALGRRALPAQDVSVMFGRVFSALVIASLVTAATVSLLPLPASQIAALTLVGLAIVLTLAGTVLGLRRGEWTLRFLLLGLLTLVATMAYEVTASLTDAVPMRANEYLLPAGSLLATLMVATALVQRLYSRERLLKYAQASVMETHRSITDQLAENVRARTFELQMANEQLARVTRVDGLTGVFNRRHFDESIANAVITARAGGKQMAIMMIDLDFFKKLNDEHGHAAGDLCLIEAGRQATDCVPEGIGMVARYGGEEFVALLPDTRAAQATEIAESIRWHIEQARPEHNGNILTMTASIGLWCGEPASDSTPASLLERADAALYRAKREGRNRVIEHESDSADAPQPARRVAAPAPILASASESALPSPDDAVFETDPPAMSAPPSPVDTVEPADPRPATHCPAPSSSGQPRGPAPRRVRRLADIDL